MLQAEIPSLSNQKQDGQTDMGNPTDEEGGIDMNDIIFLNNWSLFYYSILVLDLTTFLGLEDFKPLFKSKLF